MSTRIWVHVRKEMFYATNVMRLIPSVNDFTFGNLSTEDVEEVCLYVSRETTLVLQSVDQSTHDFNFECTSVFKSPEQWNVHMSHSVSALL